MRSRGSRRTRAGAASWLVLGPALAYAAVSCNGDSGGSTSPAAQVSAGNAFNCAVREDATVVCWGRDDLGQASPTEGSYQQVSSGITHSCGLRLSGNVACWGSDLAGESTPTEVVDADGLPGTTDDLVPVRYSQVSAGLDYTCGIAIADDPSIDPALNAMVDRTAVCWGLEVDRTGLPSSNDFGQADPPPGVKFKQISAKLTHTCGIVAADDTLSCWGRGDVANEPNEESLPPPGTFSQVSNGSRFSCAVNTAGDIECWGSDEYRKVQEAPAAGSGPYTEVSAGTNHACAVRASDGSVVCWGSDCDVSIPDLCSVLLPPIGVTFSTPAADPRPDERVPFLDGRTAPPPGAFTQISAGSAHTCGTRAGGAVECWGNNALGQSSPPQGAF